jgi:heme O synthase-like polyprenyltransferase
MNKLQQKIAFFGLLIVGAGILYIIYGLLPIITERSSLLIFLSSWFEWVYLILPSLLAMVYIGVASYGLCKNPDRPKALRLFYLCFFLGIALVLVDNWWSIMCIFLTGTNCLILKWAEG